jgi:hypothetical protein
VLPDALRRPAQVLPALEANSMNSRSSVFVRQPRALRAPAGRGARALLLLLLGALVTSALAGCASIGSDPLLAASADGHPISLSAFGEIVQISEANAAGQGPAITWQTPGGRPTWASVQRDVLEFLISGALLHQQLRDQRITVSAKDIDNRIKQFDAAIAQSLKQSPDDPNLRALDQGAQTALREHLGSRDLFDLLGGHVGEPEAITIVLANQVEHQALIAHGKVPTVHIRTIETNTLKDAQKLEQQVKGGADFGQLARQYSQNQATASKGGEVGTYHVGELSIFNQNMDKQVFDPTVQHPKKVEYLIVPHNGKFELLEITQRSTGAIADIKDTQLQAQVADAFIALVAKPNAQVTEYAAIDATATPGPLGG